MVYDGRSGPVERNLYGHPLAGLLWPIGRMLRERKLEYGHLKQHLDKGTDVEESLRPPKITTC